MTTAMILAAGRGERMRPLTDETPKALLQAGNKRLIEYHLGMLRAAGCTQVVINIAWLGEQLREVLGDGSRYGLQILFSDEGDSALETGGGISKALPLLGENPFWVINGDVHTDFDIRGVNLAANDLAHLVLVPNPPHNTQGDFALASGRIMNDGSPRFTFSGLGLYRPELFAGREASRFPLAPLLRDAADDRRVSGQLHEGVWFDVGTPERLADVAALYSD